MKILIIDDEAALRYSIARILVKGGYEVTLADDGDHGLALFRKEQPDLVICDLTMPRRYGVETITQIRRESAAMKIIAISGDERTLNVDGLAAAPAAGARAVIVKPFHAEELLDRVTVALAV